MLLLFPGGGEEHVLTEVTTVATPRTVPMEQKLVKVSTNLYSLLASFTLLIIAMNN